MAHMWPLSFFSSFFKIKRGENEASQWHDAPLPSGQDNKEYQVLAVCEQMRVCQTINSINIISNLESRASTTKSDLLNSEICSARAWSQFADESQEESPK